MEVNDSRTLLDPESEEWEVLEHYLMLCSRTSRTRIVQAWHVASPQPAMADAFAQRAAGKQRVFCWVDLANLDQSNDLRQILKRGISISKHQGMTFVHGNLIIPGLPLLSSPTSRELDPFFTVGDKRIFHFLLCELVIGNVFQIDHEADAVSHRLPAEFDSFSIRFFSESDAEPLLTSHPQSDASLASSSLTYVFPDGGPPTHSHAQLGMLPRYSFRHHYVVFHSSQVSVRYLVHVEFNPCAPEYFALPLCENCSTAAATVWCQVDAASLCDVCDQKLHETSRLAARHKRVPLEQRPRDLGHCLLHPIESCTSFCTICQRPLCALCLPQCGHQTETETSLLYGDRGLPSLKTPDKRSGAIIPLDGAFRAYIAADTASKSPSSAAVARAEKGLTVLKRLRGDIEDNLGYVQQQMHNVIGNALHQLENLVERRMALLGGRKTELQRLLEELRWDQEFIRYLHSVLPPQDFLSSWLKHQRFRERLASTQEDVHEDVIADSMRWANLHVDGSLEFRAL